MKTPTIGGIGNRYLLTFIDYFSRKLWVYFLKEKSKVFNKFKTFKTFVEKQSGHQNKSYKIWWGGEYNAICFKEFLKENGIRHQITTRYSTHPNWMGLHRGEIELLWKWPVLVENHEHTESQHSSQYLIYPRNKFISIYSWDTT